MRKFPSLRTGKYIAQGAHASVQAILALGAKENGSFKINLNPYLETWIRGHSAKICVYVNSEEALRDICASAEDAGIPFALITDGGLTEFKGVPTVTCCALGPWAADELDKITGHLPLL